MHPDNWSVSPLYDGSALMGTPENKTFTRAWRIRGAGDFARRAFSVVINRDDHTE